MQLSTTLLSAYFAAIAVAAPTAEAEASPFKCPWDASKRCFSNGWSSYKREADDEKTEYHLSKKEADPFKCPWDASKRCFSNGWSSYKREVNGSLTSTGELPEDLFLIYEADDDVEDDETSVAKREAAPFKCPWDASKRCFSNGWSSY